eukprot:3493627-Rhodomonas_salina.1
MAHHDGDVAGVAEGPGHERLVHAAHRHCDHAVRNLVDVHQTNTERTRARDEGNIAGGGERERVPFLARCCLLGVNTQPLSHSFSLSHSPTQYHPSHPRSPHSLTCSQADRLGRKDSQPARQPASQTDRQTYSQTDQNR